MPASKCDGGKDSWHGGKERVVQAAKPLGTEAEGLPSTAVLLAALLSFAGGALSFAGVPIQFCWRRYSVWDGGGHLPIKTKSLREIFKIKT